MPDNDMQVETLAETYLQSYPPYQAADEETQKAMTEDLSEEIQTTLDAWVKRGGLVKE